MDKRFDPKSYERRWQERWSASAVFRAESDSSDGSDGAGTAAKASYCIMIPPPNVTGKLHMGHALQSALQDLLVRWKRMQGYNALWLPGTDHAGIATQLMVERQLESEGTSRRELGRERFLERVWDWKAEYQNNIRVQLEALGSSCDWSRERFTMDEGLSLAVRTAFVRLYRAGRIRRGEYMVNWSPRLQTAISDLEVENRTVKGKLYHIAYPIVGGDRLVVATTRPETMLGDMAVACHPDDERYRQLIGKLATLPIVGRKIPIIGDEHVDPEFGSGLVKVTPLHDPNDFEIARRHSLDGVRVIDFDGRMTEDAGAAFAGLDRFEAREKVLELLQEQRLLVKVEDHEHSVGHSQRSGEPIEPMVSTQWFCDVEEMAGRALEAYRSGELRLVPDSWGKTWEHWLTEIRPWVLSRQLWWGHRIPAWYNQDGECFVAMDREEAEELAGTCELEQDPDVLDTWFSSGLWPLSTLGWPDLQSADLATFYPTNTLITGFDILFFWVARMVMMGLEFSDRPPFEVVHLTGLVRDAAGEKMSKTKGNTLDPLELVDEYGADAVRFTLCALDTPGRDIPLDLERMAGYRAFGNKIWNATRFALSRIGDARLLHEELDATSMELPERWILSRLSHVIESVDRRFTDFRFDEACNEIYHFFWGELCDWYIELAKPSLLGQATRPQVAQTLLVVLDQGLRLLHPVMPHLTEELWSRLPGTEELGVECLAVAPYPEPREAWKDAGAEAVMDSLMSLITRVRRLRADAGASAKLRCRLFLESGPEKVVSAVLEQASLVQFVARLTDVEAGKGPPAALRDRVNGMELALDIERDLTDAPDSGAERARLQKELAEIGAEVTSALGRLNNPQFVEKAPPQVVEGSRRRLAELEERKKLLSEQLGVTN